MERFGAFPISIVDSRDFEQGCRGFSFRHHNARVFSPFQAHHTTGGGAWLGIVVTIIHVELDFRLVVASVTIFDWRLRPAVLHVECWGGQVAQGETFLFPQPLGHILDDGQLDQREKYEHETSAQVDIHGLKWKKGPLGASGLLDRIGYFLPLAKLLEVSVIRTALSSAASYIQSPPYDLAKGCRNHFPAGNAFPLFVLTSEHSGAPRLDEQLMRFLTHSAIGTHT